MKNVEPQADAAKINKRADRFCINAVRGMIYFILAYAIVSCIVCLCGLEFFGIRQRFEFLAWILIPFFLFLLYRSRKLENTVLLKGKRFFWIGLAVANCVMLAILFSFNTQPISDYSGIYDMACKMHDGTFDVSSMNALDYEKVFNWQIGIAWLESLIFKSYHVSVNALKFANLLFINATLVLTYYVARLLRGEQSARVSFVLMSCFYPVLVSVGQFSNNNVVAPLLLVFILLIAKKRYIAAGILLPVISFIRPLGIIVLLALGVLMVYKVITRRFSWRKISLTCLKFAIPFLLTTWIIDEACIRAGYADAPVSKPTLSYFKFHQGLNIKSWEGPFDDLQRFDGDYEAYNEWEKNLVKDKYLNEPVKTLSNNFLKMIMFLGQYDWKFAYTYNQSPPNFNSRLISCCVVFGWAQYFVLIILCIFGYGSYVKERGVDLLQILFIGIICVYFFIEAWPSYRYEIYPFMFIFAGSGIRHLGSLHVRYLCKFRR